MPAEFPGTSLSCISILPKRYSFLDWKPEPEALSSESVRSSPLLSILARPSPQVMSKCWLKLQATKEHINRDTQSRSGMQERDAVLESSKANLESIVVSRVKFLWVDESLESLMGKESRYENTR